MSEQLDPLSEMIDMFGPLGMLLNEPKATLKLSFAEAFRKLSTYLYKQKSDIRDEELHVGNTDLTYEQLVDIFKVMLLSYFSVFELPASMVIAEMFEDLGIDVDYFEGANSEVALGMLEDIDRVAAKYFPSLARGSLKDLDDDGDNPRSFSVSDLADQLQVADSFLRGNDTIVIAIPLRVLHQLQHAVSKSTAAPFGGSNCAADLAASAPAVSPKPTAENSD